MKNFANKSELFDWLRLNKEILTAEKISGEMKRADACQAPLIIQSEAGEVDKANKPVNEDVDSLKVKIVINTTNLMDGHDDVHIPGLWDKSLKENKRLMHLQEHEMKFDHIIADKSDLKAYVQTLSWKELGYNLPGETQALIFESNVKRERNEYMFKEYKQGNVDNHSVGMRYVKLFLCMNSDSAYDAAEKANWDKYIDQVANRKQAEDKGYFWAVTEAKAIEGSAVPAGSNWITPTLENNMKSEPPEGTLIEPEKTTQITSEEIKETIKNFNFKFN